MDFSLNFLGGEFPAVDKLRERLSMDDSMVSGVPMILFLLNDVGGSPLSFLLSSPLLLFECCVCCVGACVG